MLRGWNVTWKILATLAVPILALVSMTAYISISAFQDRTEAIQSEDLMGVMELQDASGKAFTTELATVLTAEAAQSDPSQVQIVKDASKAAVADAQAQTDSKLTKLVDSYRALDVSALDPAVAAAVDDAVATRARLGDIRTKATGAGVTGAVKEYSSVVDAAMAVPQAFAESTSDRELARYVNAYIHIDDSYVHVDLEKPMGSLVFEAVKAKSLNPDMRRIAAGYFSEGAGHAAMATDAVRGLGLEDVTFSRGGEYATISAAIAASSPESVGGGMADKWGSLADATALDVAQVRDKVREATRDKASASAAEATKRALVTGGSLILVAAFSILFAWAIARTIGRPLRQLTAAAQGVRNQLPGIIEQAVVPGDRPAAAFTPIEVRGHDEIARLAAAFNDVNAQTLEVAREQAELRGSIAEMFVNVARRDQVLLNRQLAFLDDLERNEGDPGTLSNFFRLDHLATRMRRNSESLLVLAGIDSGRRVRQPMALSDVIRTASSEIELFDRVRLNLSIDPLILAHNALNAAHLIAELLENATMYSEPHTPVEVTTVYNGQFVRILVRDHGLGMAPEEIEEINRRVASISATEIVGAQRLGLYVVGRLSNRMGAKIAFAPSADGAGTEASIDMPISLFAADSNAGLSQGMPSGVAELEQLASAESTAAALPIVEPEPPVAVPVDLDALTDGTTASGMPRRRSRAVEPAPAAPSAIVSQAPQTGAIVLPPIVTPNLPIDLPQGEDSWLPPEDVTMPGRALPSRQRATHTALAPVQDPVLPSAPAANGDNAELPVIDAGTRSALFSRFRSMGELDSSLDAPESPVELAPAPDMSAADISVPVAEESSGDEWAPTFALDDNSALTTRPMEVDEPTPNSPVFGSGDSTGSDTPSLSEARQPFAPAEPLRESGLPTRPGATKRPAAPESAGPARPEGWLSALTDESTAPRTHGRDEAAAMPAVPSISELLSGAAAFGRESLPSKDSASAAAVAPSTSSDNGSPELSPPKDGAASSDAQEVPDDLGLESLPRFEELMSGLPTRRSTREAAGSRRGLFARRSAQQADGQAEAPRAEISPELPSPIPAPPSSAAEEWPGAATPAFGAGPTSPDALPFASNPAFLPANRQYTPFSSPLLEEDSEAEDTQTAPLPVVGGVTKDVPRHASLGEQAASIADRADGAPAFGPPKPLTRRHARDIAQPDRYADDSVEARSEWTASAVLREEMSSLLRSTGDSTLGAGPVDGAYQPVRMDAGQRPHLSRRPMENREGYVDRFTARIDRDPEQLRARLAAFQSATARGRAETQDETDV